MDKNKYVQEIKKEKTIWWRIRTATIATLGLLLVDYEDLPSRLLRIIPEPLFVALIIVLLVVVISIAIEKDILKQINTKSINMFDHISIVMIIVFVFCFIYELIVFRIGYLHYKSLLCIVAAFIEVAFIIYRQHYVNRNGIVNSEGNVIELNKLYDGEIDYDLHESFLISDNDDIDYDLLNHEFIVNELYQSINQCKAQKSIVYGIDGEWGSGKTTIINKVKRKIINDSQSTNVKVLDDFDPWLYGNQEALLSALYSKILEKTNIRYSRIKVRRLLKAIGTTLTDTNTAGKVANILLFNGEIENEVTKGIIDDLKKFLISIDERYVLFIDNLDRADADNILFLLRIIATSFDLPNLIYVLLYDRARISSILNNNKQIDPRFLDKIIQVEYRIPLSTPHKREEIYTKCINNLLQSIEISDDELKEYKSIILYITKKAGDLRAFKRLLNSVFCASFIWKTCLSKRDLLAIETIRFFDSDLYSSIYDNRQFFIAFDLTSDPGLWVASFSKTKYNQEGKEYLSSLRETKPECIDLLSSLFPLVNRFNSGQDLRSDYGDYSESSYIFHAQRMSICNKKYFDLYFVYGMNFFAAIGMHIRETINAINASASMEEAEEYFKRAFRTIPEVSQKEWFDRFELYLDHLYGEKKYSVAIAIIQSIEEIDDSFVFLTLNAKSRAEHIVYRILKDIDIEQFSLLISEACSSYRNFRLIKEFLSDYQSERVKSENDQKEQMLKKYAAEMCCKVIEQRIDLFDDEYYVAGNTRSFAIVADKTELNPEQISQYITNIVTERTVYRYIYEITAIGHQTTSSEEGVSFIYHISKDLESRLYIEKDVVQHLLEVNPPDNEGKDILNEAYEKYLQYGDDLKDYEKNCVIRQEKVEFFI